MFSFLANLPSLNSENWELGIADIRRTVGWNSPSKPFQSAVLLMSGDGELLMCIRCARNFLARRFMDVQSRVVVAVATNTFTEELCDELEAELTSLEEALEFLELLANSDREYNEARVSIQTRILH